MGYIIYKNEELEIWFHCIHKYLFLVVYVYYLKQVHLFMQEHEKRKPWRVIIPSKYQLKMIYTKCWLSLPHWDESILLSNHICIKSQQTHTDILTA